MADNEQQTTDPGNGEDGSEGFSEAFTARAAGEEGKDEAQASSTTEGAADTAASDEAPEQSAADDTSGTKPQGFDPWADLKPEQKTYFERLHASERSNRGRVGALTKKLNGFTSGTGTQAPPAKQDETDDQSQGTGEGEAAKTAAEALEAKLDAVAEEYGDVLGPLPELVKELRKEITDLKASKTRDEVDADAEALAEAYDRLGEAHPDYQDIAGSREFNEWIGKQPQKVQALLNSYDPAEVSLGLKLYKVESGIGANSGGSDQGDTGDATGDRRERQLGGLRQATTRGAPAASGVPNDFGAAFKQRAKNPS